MELLRLVGALTLALVHFCDFRLLIEALLVLIFLGFGGFSSPPSKLLLLIIWLWLLWSSTTQDDDEDDEEEDEGGEDVIEGSRLMIVEDLEIFDLFFIVNF